MNNGTRIGAAAGIVIAQLVSVEYFNADPAVALGIIFGAGTMIALDIADHHIWHNPQITTNSQEDDR